MYEAYLIAGLLAVAAVIISYCAYREISYARKFNRTTQVMYKQLQLNAEIHKAAAAKSDAMAKMFANILVDLANSKDKSVIEWKLHHIRSVGEILRSAGWDNKDVCAWLMRMIDDKPCEVQTGLIDEIEESIKSYYIMDPEVGMNACDILRIVAMMASWQNACDNEYSKAMGQLLHAIDSLRLKFIMYDAVAEAQHKAEQNSDMRSFEELLLRASDLVSSIDSVPEEKPPATPTVEVDDEERSSDEDVPMVETTETESAAGVHPVRETADPQSLGLQLQGEEAEDERQGQVPEDVQGVIVVDGPKQRLRVEPAEE